MKTIIVDDEKFCAEYLKNLCTDLGTVEVVGSFQNVPAALDYLAEFEVDLAFLDIEMPGIKGLEAADRMREINPELNLVFVTGYDQYAMDAFKRDAVSYLLKPCDPKELEKAVQRARKLMAPPQPVAAPALPPVIKIQTFGHFTVLVNGRPYRFANRKAKELLALLVDFRGGDVLIEQATDCLWEARPYDDTVKQLYRKAIVSLRQFMKDAGMEFLDISRGKCHIIPPLVDCDYFRLLAGDTAAVREFSGEYLTEYSWAEPTLARIERLLEK